MAINKSLVRGSVFFFYLLIGLEIVIMISPFAAYFYSVYGPLLNFLYDYKITAWLTGFFLPHAVVSKSTLLNVIGGFGRILRHRHEETGLGLQRFCRVRQCGPGSGC